MLNGSIGGAAVKSIIKICEEWDISVESQKNEEIDHTQGYYFNPEAAKWPRIYTTNSGIKILFDAAKMFPPLWVLCNQRG